MATSRKITLRSCEGESFEVELSVAVQSVLIEHMIEDDCADNAIPLPNVNRKILAKVIEYCNQHQDITAWDAKFVDVDKAVLFELFKAADYLHIDGLLHLTCQTVTDMIRDMIRDKIFEEAVEEIRSIFGIKKEDKDFTISEEEEKDRILSILKEDKDFTISEEKEKDRILSILKEESDAILTPQDIRRILGV